MLSGVVFYRVVVALAYDVPVVVGLALLPASLVEVFYNCNPNPQKTHSQLAVLSPYWAFCFKGKPGKNRKVELNSEL